MTGDRRPVGAAIILAGGRARRLDGATKPMLPVAGRPLIEHALAAAAGRHTIVVVGGPFAVDIENVTWALEDPPFGGPVAGVITGLGAIDDEADAAEVLLLASDLPDAVRLVKRLDASAMPADADGVVAIDETGRQQWLAGRYRLASLRRAAAELGTGDGASMRALLAGLSLVGVDVGETAVDLDTWDAIEQYRSAHARDEEGRIHG